MLRILEETVPVQRIWIDMAEQPDMPAGPFEFAPDDELLDVARAMFLALTENKGLSEDEAREHMRGLEVFGALADDPALGGA